MNQFMEPLHIGPAEWRSLRLHGLRSIVWFQGFIVAGLCLTVAGMFGGLGLQFFRQPVGPVWYFAVAVALIAGGTISSMRTWAFYRAARAAAAHALPTTDARAHLVVSGTRERLDINETREWWLELDAIDMLGIKPEDRIINMPLIRSHGRDVHIPRAAVVRVYGRFAPGEVVFVKLGERVLMPRGRSCGFADIGIWAAHDARVRHGMS